MCEDWGTVYRRAPLRSAPLRQTWGARRAAQGGPAKMGGGRGDGKGMGGTPEKRAREGMRREATKGKEGMTNIPLYALVIRNPGSADVH